MSELRTCPFCGGLAFVDFCDSHSYFVRCGKCGVNQDKLYGQRCDAIKAWNKRADDYIPVIEKVPKWGQRCLILGAKGGLYLGKYLDGGFYDDRGKWINTAVAWKPVVNLEGEVL